jgi:hypothetical protein
VVTEFDKPIFLSTQYLFFCRVLDETFLVVYIFSPVYQLECMRCGYEVPGMILLQAYLFTYSLLRGVTFEVPLLSNYALSPTVLPLLETFFGTCVVE